MNLEQKLEKFENDPNWFEVNLPVDPGDERQEAVLVERFEDETLRIAITPGLVENLAEDDVIALDSDRPEGYRLLRRGGNLALRFVLPQGDEQSLSRARQFLDAELEGLGGQLDGTIVERALVYTVPVSAGFEAVESVMERACTQFQDSAWWYGNVYDPSDKPLNWWL